MSRIHILKFSFSAGCGLCCWARLDLIYSADQDDAVIDLWTIKTSWHCQRKMSCPEQNRSRHRGTSPQDNQQYYSNHQNSPSTKTCRRRALLQTKRLTTHYFPFCDINVSLFVFPARFRYYESSRRASTREKKKKLIVSSARYASWIWARRRKP